MSNIFLQKASDIEIELKEKIVTPVAVCNVIEDEKYYKGWGIEKIKDYDGLDEAVFGEFCYDLGEHYVGYFSFGLDGYGEVCDSPVKLKITFAEVPFDFSHKDGEEPGWLSYSWIQEEIIHVDELPARVELPRRFAARYAKISIVAKNKRMTLQIKDVRFRAVSSAGFDYSLDGIDPKYKKIGEVSCRTMRDCMQLVYEDGPKRDHRLWLGDLRLQALSNYHIFKDTKLFKKCMYLFAGLPNEDGTLCPCLYITPKPLNGNLYLCDYSFMFMTCLWDYYEFSGDIDFCRELFDIAYNQFRIFYKMVNPDGTIKPQEGWWTFVDWDNNATPREETTGAVAAYCLGHTIKLAEILGYDDIKAEAEKYRNLLNECAMNKYFDKELGVFAPRGVVSWNTNAFMILAGAVSKEDGIEIMKKLKGIDNAVTPVTPYVYHYLADTYDYLGMIEERDEIINSYWGAMIELGADTFWEAFKPGDPFISPYDDSVLNSACHAWSCTPMYFFSKNNNN